MKSLVEVLIFRNNQITFTTLFQARAFTQTLPFRDTFVITGVYFYGVDIFIINL